MPEHSARNAVPLSERLALTVSETAAMLGISRSKAYELVGTGELPSVRLGDRLIVPRRQLEERLEQLLAQHRGA